MGFEPTTPGLRVPSFVSPCGLMGWMLDKGSSTGWSLIDSTPEIAVACRDYPALLVDTGSSPSSPAGVHGSQLALLT